MGSYISKSEQSRDVADSEEETELPHDVANSKEKTKPSRAVADSVNIFGAKLLVEYRKKQNPNNNIVFSPLNLATTFHLVYQGADGETKTQINNLLNFSNPEVEASLTGKSQDLATRGATSMANRVYVDKSIELLENYIEHVGSTQVRSVDFAKRSECVRTEINEWVNQETHGLIPTLVSQGQISKETLMALVNALYFKGKWKYQFNPGGTRTGVFHGVNGDQNVSYMTLYDKYLSYKEVPELGGIMFELPYKENDFGLYVFLPDNVDGWKQVEQAYPEYAGKIFSTSFTGMKVNELKLPKWEMDSTFESLKDSLKSLGIRDIFSDEANLSAMTNSTQLLVSTVVHKAKIIVDEKGTEAAAATGLKCIKLCLILPSVYITVDRPFLYFVVDRSDGTVLFQGTQTFFP